MPNVWEEAILRSVRKTTNASINNTNAMMQKYSHEYTGMDQEVRLFLWYMFRRKHFQFFNVFSC